MSTAILAAEVDPMEGYANPPKVTVTVASVPSISNHIYTRLEMPDGALYLSYTHDPQVSFLAEMSGNQRGYGGRTFHLDLDTGAVAHVVGPWSSSASAVNGLINEHGLDLPHVMDVELRTEGERLHYSGSVTVESLRQAGIPLFPTRFHGGVLYVVDLDAMSIVNL